MKSYFRVFVTINSHRIIAIGRFRLRYATSYKIKDFMFRFFGLRCRPYATAKKSEKMEKIQDKRMIVAVSKAKK